MRRLLAASLLCLLPFLALPVGVDAAIPKKSPLTRREVPFDAGHPDVVPGEFIVRFKTGFVRSLSGSRFGSLIRPLGRRLALVRLPLDTTASEGVSALSKDPGVAVVEPNYRRYLTAVPDDPLLAQQWGLNNTAQAHPMSDSTATKSGLAGADMDVFEAWDEEMGDPETVIAILDSGVDVAHPDLLPNLWTNPDETPGNGIDDDLNTLVDDVYGWDFADNDATLLEANSSFFGWDHGTHVAGIAAAAGNNATGVAGVCPFCRIMTLKFFEPIDTDQDGVMDTMAGDLAAEIAAINYAIANGADVINGSFGGYMSWSRMERTALQRAVNAGITVILAAGNENTDNDLALEVDLDFDGQADALGPSFPSSYDIPGMVVVAASTDADQNGFNSACASDRGSPFFPCTFTNWGHDSVDASAPGVDILSTLPNNSYGTFDGTSMASPNVAGVAGLVKSLHPTFTAHEVANAVINSVDLKSSLNELFLVPPTPFTGQFTRTGGRVNAERALSGSTAALPISDGSIRGAAAILSKRTGTVEWPEDVNDVYKKKLSRDQVWAAVLNGPSNADFDLWAYRPGAKDLWQGVGMLGLPKIGDADESFRFRVRKTGVHYFQVAAYPDVGGSYTLKLVRLR